MPLSRHKPGAPVKLQRDTGKTAPTPRPRAATARGKDDDERTQWHDDWIARIQVRSDGVRAGDTRFGRNFG